MIATIVALTRDRDEWQKHAEMYANCLQKVVEVLDPSIPEQRDAMLQIKERIEAV